MSIIFVRSLIIYLSIVVALRIMGKRQLGELEPHELVVAVLISDLASHPLQDIGIPLLNGLLAIVVLLCCELIFTGIIIKSVRARVLLCGRPSMLIANGEILQKEMKKNRFTLDELTEELRNQSITDISKIQYAILEISGQLNTVLFPAERPVTVSQMNIPVDDTGYPSIIINDGKVLENNLKRLGRDINWLESELKRRKVKSAMRVYLMTLDHGGQIYLTMKEGR